MSSTNCTICWTTFTPAPESPSAGCHHAVCSDCLREFFTSSFKAPAGGYGDFPRNNQCPVLGCSLSFPENTIRQFLTSVEYEKHMQLQVQRCLSEMTDVRFCVKPGCNGVGYGTSSANCTNFVCTECYTPQCFSCRSEAHGVMSCDAYKKWKAANYEPEKLLLSAWKSLNLKSCKQCGTASELESGCNHVMCSNCAFVYCWTCLNAWEKNGCRGYSCTGDASDAAVVEPVRVVAAAPAPRAQVVRRYLERRDPLDMAAWEMPARRRAQPQVIPNTTKPEEKKKADDGWEVVKNKKKTKPQVPEPRRRGYGPGRKIRA